VGALYSIRIERLAIAVLFLASATTASAQSYPSRPITIVVPTTAGGPPDAIARILGERMKVTLGPIKAANIRGE